MKKVCVYFDNDADTVDHIPPKGIFSDRTNMIVVPCCLSCNNGFSKDDEYFRFVLNTILGWFN